MPRALQSASLAFGLVNIPVKLYTAATSQSVSFHLLHKKDQSRIHEQIVCIAEDTPVSRDELVKGYEVKKGTYVEVTEEELDALEAQVNRSVEIQEFIPIEAVDPVSFKKTYYLGPDKGGEKPYQLLAQAMQRERKGAIAQFVQRGKEELVMVRPVRENRLMLHVLYYADEVRAFEGAPSGKAASTAELNLAVQLIHQLASKTWDSAKYHDTYRERVLAFIKRKQAGEKMETPKPARAPGKVLDLMGTLKQSLAHANQPRTTRKNPHTKRKKVKGTRKAA
jgi:DNA end-binding protein Ku